jgi:hypothetical protein
VFKAEQYSFVSKYHILLIFSFVYRFLGCFPVLAIENDVAVNIDVQISLQGTAFGFWRYGSSSRVPA